MFFWTTISIFFNRKTFFDTLLSPAINDNFCLNTEALKTLPCGKGFAYPFVQVMLSGIFAGLFKRNAMQQFMLIRGHQGSEVASL